jgi:hypothetical protein
MEKTWQRKDIRLNTAARKPNITVRKRNTAGKRRNTGRNESKLPVGLEQ